MSHTNETRKDDDAGPMQTPAEVLRAHLDDDAWRVYGDWLQEAGDPRGELIAIELALSSALPPARRGRLVLERDRLSAELNKLSGRFAPLNARPVWARGHLKSLHLRSSSPERGRPGGEGTKLLYDLLTEPIARFLQELSLELRGSETMMDAFIEAVVAAAPPLRRLTLQLTGPSARGVVPCNLEPLWPALHWLKDLVFQAKGVRPRFGSILSLTLETADLYAPLGASLKPLATARWPRLHRLHLEFRDPVLIDALELILDSMEPQALRDLGIHLGGDSFSRGDELCHLLPNSRVLPRLKKLDLSSCGITDVGGAALLAHPGAFQHLDRLDLSRNLLSEGFLKGAGAGLRNLCRHVPLDPQIRSAQDPSMTW